MLVRLCMLVGLCKVFYGLLISSGLFWCSLAFSQASSPFSASVEGVVQILDGEDIHFVRGRWFSQPLSQIQGTPFAEVPFLSKSHHINLTAVESGFPILEGADNFSVTGQYYLNNQWYVNAGYAKSEFGANAYRLAMGRFLLSTLDIELAWIEQDLDNSVITPSIIYNHALLSRGEAYEGFPVALPMLLGDNRALEAKARYLGEFDRGLVYAASLYFRVSDVDQRIGEPDLDDLQTTMSLRFKLYPNRSVGIGAEFSGVIYDDDTYIGVALYGDYFYRHNLSFTGRLSLASDRQIGQEGLSVGVNYLF